MSESGGRTLRVCVTERRESATPDLRPAGELAPELALPWVARLRYGVLAGQAGLILVAHFALGVRLPVGWLTIPLAATGFSNLLLRRAGDAFGVRPAVGALLALDTLCLTALLALTGGRANPFSLLYLVQIALSAVILSKGWTWGIGGLSVACFAFLFRVYVPLPVFEVHHMGGGLSVHLAGMWIAFTAAALLITIFIGKVSEALRLREQEAMVLRDRLARQERLGSIVTLAAGAAHELATPLGTIAVASKDLEYYATKVAPDEQVAGEARLIRTEVERCRRILHDMGARGAEPAGEAPARVGLPELLESVARGFPEQAARIRIAIAGGGREAVLPVEATRQALAALVRNALDASPGGGTVRLAAERSGARVRLTVEDSGCGMSAETLNRLAEPFFTTKGAGRGMGLGTFLVREFAQEMNGTLAFESGTGVGTKAILDVPG
jgi:two-component system, sensor histidine kinase RegB